MTATVLVTLFSALRLKIVNFCVKYQGNYYFLSLYWFAIMLIYFILFLEEYSQNLSGIKLRDDNLLPLTFV